YIGARIDKFLKRLRRGGEYFEWDRRAGKRVKIHFEGAAFRYMLVSEVHEGGGANHGNPHVHMLLFETDASHPLRKHAFESVWSAVCAVTGASRAVSHFRLVGADDRRQVYYLTKYISKEASLVRMSKNFGSGPVPTKSAAVSADRLAASRSEVSTDEISE